MFLRPRTTHTGSVAWRTRRRAHILEWLLHVNIFALQLGRGTMRRVVRGAVRGTTVVRFAMRVSWAIWRLDAVDNLVRRTLDSNC